MPPAEFAHRVGCAPAHDWIRRYLSIGARIRAEIDEMLPSAWTWDGKRVLDFGCGPGRVLRHFLGEAEVAEFHGSDIDGEMIAWLQANLCPPLAAANVNGPAPPLPYRDSSFDLVIATSVFTHIVDEWSAWLLEIHRILKPNGLLLATFLGRGMSEAIAGEPWDPHRIAMNPLNLRGGTPDVLHSEWWLREHWGRAFEFLELRPDGFATGRNPAGIGGHGSMLLRPRPVSLRPADLERERSGDNRYTAARSHHLDQLRAARARRRSGRVLARRITRAVTRRARTRP